MKTVEDYIADVLPDFDLLFTNNTRKKLTEAMHDYASQSRWISCEERLPESGQCVLIYSEDGGVAEGCYVASENHYDQFRWSCTHHQNDVSHWQPLPQPPKQ